MTNKGIWFLALALSAASGSARADTITVRVWPPGVGVAAAEISSSPRGVERFESLQAGSNTAFTTAFGTTGMSGRYSGDFSIMSSSAGLGTGQAIGTIQPHAEYVLTLRHDGSVPGVNFFALDLNPLDAGNVLTFYRNLSPIGQFTTANFAAIAGTAATGTSPIFFGFTDETGMIDQVGFSQITPGAAFRSDNHTVGYVKSAAVLGKFEVPEPGQTALFAFSLLGLAAYRMITRHRQPQNEGRVAGT